MLSIQARGHNATAWPYGNQRSKWGARASAASGEAPKAEGEGREGEGREGEGRCRLRASAVRAFNWDRC